MTTLTGKIATLAQSAAELGFDSYPGDVSDRGPVQSMVEGILGRHGHIDILVTSAGTNPKAPMLELSDDSALQEVGRRSGEDT